MVSIRLPILLLEPHTISSESLLDFYYAHNPVFISVEYFRPFASYGLALFRPLIQAFN